MPQTSRRTSARIVYTEEDPWPAPATEPQYLSSLPHTAAVSMGAVFALATLIFSMGVLFDYSKAPY
jgi:hypothetical protein